MQIGLNIRRYRPSLTVTWLCLAGYFALTFLLVRAASPPSQRDAEWQGELDNLTLGDAANPSTDSEPFLNPASILLSFVPAIIGLPFLPNALLLLFRSGLPWKPRPLARLWTWWRVLGAYFRSSFAALAIAALAGWLLARVSIALFRLFDAIHAPKVVSVVYEGFYLLLFFLLMVAGTILPVWWTIRRLTPGWAATRRTFGIQSGAFFTRPNIRLALGGYAFLFIVGTLWAHTLTALGLSTAGDIESREFPFLGIFALPAELFWGCLLAPLTEELFFRGFLLTSLLQRMGLVSAVVLSSLLFAVCHFYSFGGTVSVFFIGCILSLLFVRTGSLCVPILCHGLYNLVLTILRHTNL